MISLFRLANLINLSRLLSCLPIVIFLAGCAPVLSPYTYISLEGDWPDSVIRRGKLPIDPGTNFFIGEIDIAYRYGINNLIIYAELLPTTLPSIKFHLQNLQGLNEELSIYTNHPCYSNQRLSYKRGADGKYLVPMERDKSTVTYQFVNIKSHSDWIKKNKPDCYGKELTEPLFIILESAANSFHISIPIKVNKHGFHIYFDGV